MPRSNFSLAAWILLCLSSALPARAEKIQHNPRECPKLTGLYKPAAPEGGTGTIEVRSTIQNDVTVMEFVGLEDGFEDPGLYLDGKTRNLSIENDPPFYFTASCRKGSVIVQMRAILENRKEQSSRLTFSLDTEGNLLVESRMRGDEIPGTTIKYLPSR